MILAIPMVIFLFGLSLRGQAGFEACLNDLHSWPFKLIISLLGWTLSHHILAGLRFLLLDINIGEKFTEAKVSAWVVNIAGLLVFIYILLKIWI